jgi:hypothetical protein
MDEHCVENKIDKYLSREWQIILGVVGILYVFYSMVLIPIRKTESDLAFIRENHLVHIEQEINEIRKKQCDRDLSDAEMRENIVKILTILEEQKANNLDK